MSVPKDQTAHKHKKSYLKSPYVRSGRSSCNTILVEQVLSPLSCIHSRLKKIYADFLRCIAYRFYVLLCETVSFTHHLSKPYTNYYFALSKLHSDLVSSPYGWMVNFQLCPDFSHTCIIYGMWLFSCRLKLVHITIM